MTRQSLLLVLGIILLAHAPAPAYGQQVTAGDSIRVMALQSAEPKRQWGVEQPKPEWTEATVVRLTPDTLWYEASGNVSPIPMDNADIQRPMPGDYRVAGAVIGGVAGGVVGGLIGYATHEPKFGFGGSGFGGIGGGIACAISGCRTRQINSRAEDTANAALALAGIGGGLGYLLGKAAGRWETVELDQITGL